MTRDGEANANADGATAASAAREIHNWFDSTWELRRGLEVIEDVPPHLWPPGLSRRDPGDFTQV